MKRILYIIFLGFLMMTFLNCGNSEKEKDETKANETAANESNEIVVSHEQFKESKMQIGTLQQKTFPILVKATGQIDVPPKNRAVISAFSGGYIKNIPLLIGDKVKKGQALLSLENPEFITMQQDYLEVAEQLTYLESEYLRQKTLFEEKITSQKKYLQAESAYNMVRAVYNATRKKLILLNINPDAAEKGSITSVVTLFAPITGSISKVDAIMGMYVSPADEIIEIIDSDHIHLELSIFEKDVMNVKEKQQILFTIPEASEDILHAEVHLVGNTIDEVNRTTKVHGHLEEDTNYNIVVGMFVNANIVVSETNAMALPEEAIISVGNKYYVLTTGSKDDYRFSQKEVTIGKTYDGFIEILNIESFDEKTHFLTRGGFNLISE